MSAHRVPPAPGTDRLVPTVRVWTLSIAVDYTDCTPPKAGKQTQTNPLRLSFLGSSICAQIGENKPIEVIAFLFLRLHRFWGLILHFLNEKRFPSTDTARRPKQTQTNPLGLNPVAPGRYAKIQAKQTHGANLPLFQQLRAISGVNFALFEWEERFRSMNWLESPSRAERSEESGPAKKRATRFLLACGSSE
jgi:hypothetical protein